MAAAGTVTAFTKDVLEPFDLYANTSTQVYIGFTLISKNGVAILKTTDSCMNALSIRELNQHLNNKAPGALGRRFHDCSLEEATTFFISAKKAKKNWETFYIQNSNGPHDRRQNVHLAELTKLVSISDIFLTEKI